MCGFGLIRTVRCMTAFLSHPLRMPATTAAPGPVAGNPSASVSLMTARLVVWTGCTVASLAVWRAAAMFVLHAVG
jgi:hypothetical protein